MQASVQIQGHLQTVHENQKILKKEVTHKEITLMRIEKSLLKGN
jgi:hypothetical protein